MCSLRALLHGCLGPTPAIFGVELDQARATRASALPNELGKRGLQGFASHGIEVTKGDAAAYELPRRCFWPPPRSGWLFSYDAAVGETSRDDPTRLAQEAKLGGMASNLLAEGLVVFTFKPERWRSAMGFIQENQRGCPQWVELPATFLPAGDFDAPASVTYECMYTFLRVRVANRSCRSE